MNSIDQARQDLQEKLDQGADPSALDELDTINTRRKRVQLSAMSGLGIAERRGSISMGSTRWVTIDLWPMPSAKCFMRCIVVRWSPSAN